MTVTDDDKMPIGHNSLLSQRFHEARDRLEGIGATLGEDGGEGGGESPVIGHYVLLCGAGCSLRAHGFSGHRARLWGRAAVCASGRRGHAPRFLRCPSCRWRWGFCSIRSWLSACRRRVVVLMTPFPPFGGGEAATWGGVLAKLQTHWAKYSDNRSL